MAFDFSIRNLTKHTPPRVPFRIIARNVLGANASVSLVFTTPGLSRKLNRERRDKDYVANVLTFPLGKNSGEICICLSEAKKESEKFQLSYRRMVGLLFIHAILHLKGVPHGGTMNRTERRLLKQFLD